MRYEIFQCIQSLDKSTWNQLTAGYPFAGWQWYRYDECVLGGDNIYYVIIYAADEPIAAAAFSVRYQEQLPTNNPIGISLLEKYLHHRPLLVARTPALTNHTGLFMPEDTRLHREILANIRQAAIEIAKTRGASFILFDYLPEDMLDYDWGNFSQLTDFLDDGTQLDLIHDNWDDYLQAIRQRSKGTHKDIRRQLNKRDKMGATVSFKPEVSDIERASALIANVNQKYDNHVIPYLHETLQHIPMLSGQGIWLSVEVDEKMMGCGLLYHDVNTGVCEPVLYGRDYGYDSIYLFTYYEIIRYAIDTLKAKTIYGGSGNYEFKFRLGFEPDKRNNFMLYSHRMIERNLMKLFL